MPANTNTLTIRKVPDDCVAALKKAARDNNRSMESQVRSILEDYTAEYIAGRITTNADLVAAIERILAGAEKADAQDTPPDGRNDRDDHNDGADRPETHESVTDDFHNRVRMFMDRHGIEGFARDEFTLPDRDLETERRVPSFDRG